MTELLKVGDTQNAETMTSLQIAELVGKRHDHILRDIRNMEQNLNKALTPDVGAGHERTANAMRGYIFKDSTYIDRSGKSNVQIELNKKSCLLLASGYDVVLRAAIIDRWEELEMANKTQIPQTYAEALMLAAQQAQLIEQQQTQLVEQAPKVEFFDAVTGSSDTIDMASVAKVLNMGVGRNKLFEILRDKKVLMTNNAPMQRYIDQGWFRQIESKYTKPNGDTCINIKTVVYQKGVNGIRNILSK